MAGTAGAGRQFVTFSGWTTDPVSRNVFEMKITFMM